MQQVGWSVPRWLRGLLALGLASGALAFLLLGLVRTRSTVMLDVDGQRYSVRTHATTVGAVLRQAGLQLFPQDQITPELASPLRAGTVISIQRARTVALSADGYTRQLRTQATTVGQLLAEAGLQIGPADEIWLDGQLVGQQTPLRGVGLAPRQVSHRGGQRLPLAPQQTDPPQIVLRRALSLTLDDGGVTTLLHTTASTVGQVLQAEGVALFPVDLVTPGLEEPIRAGMVVTIDRSVPVQIEVDGRSIRARTRAGSVAGVLGQEGIALVGLDTVEPRLADPVWAGMTIRVTRLREEFAVEFEPIPFQAVTVADPELEIDRWRLAQEGQIGLTKRRYRIRYENDQEVARFLEDTWAERPPITKTLAYGTKIVVRTLETPDGPIEYWRKMRVYTTSYTPSSAGKPPDHPRYGYTRLGWKVVKGVVAVDPDVIPLKTRMYIPGYGFARAGDTGGGVKGKFVDLGFEDGKYESWHWWTDIYLLTPVPPRSTILWVLPNWPKYPDRGKR